MSPTQPPPDVPPALAPKWAALRERQELERNQFLARVAADKAEFDKRVATQKAEFDKRVAAQRVALLKRHFEQDNAFFSNAAQHQTGLLAGAARTDSARMLPPEHTQRTKATPARTGQPPQTLPAPANAGRRVKQDPRNTATEIIDLCSDDDDEPPAQTCPVAYQKPVVQPTVAPRNPVAQQPGFQSSSLQTTPHQEDEDEVCMIIDSDASSSASLQNTNLNPSIPSASISLFGGPPKDTGYFPKFKREPSATPQLSSPMHASPDNPTEKQFSGFPLSVSSVSTPLARPSTAMPPVSSPMMAPTPSTPSQATWTGTRSNTPFTRPASTATPPPAHGPVSPSTLFTFNGPQSRSPFRPPLVPDKSPDLPFSSLRQQQQDRSSILREPTPLSKNPALFRLEQQKRSGSFVNNVLYNERSQSLAPELRDVLANKAFDVEMEDGSDQAAVQQQHSPRTPMTPAPPSNDDIDSMYLTADTIHVATPSRNAAPLTPPPSNEKRSERHQSAPQTPVLPPHSRKTIPSEPNKTSQPAFTPSFKKPTLPASATPDGRHARAGTADSQASSFTLPAPRTQRGESIASRTSDVLVPSSTTSQRKRPVEMCLSSSEEEDVSDYEPSEPDSLSASKLSRQTKDMPVAKKSKAANGPTPNPKRLEKGKNAYGFRSAPPKAAAPPHKKSAPSSSAPASESTASSKPKPKKPVPQPSKRRAAMTAESKVRRCYEQEEEFNTECAIEDADRVEEARLPDHMRGLSMTPTPSETQVRAEFIGNDAASPPRSSRTTTSSKQSAPSNTSSFAHWTHNRARGDRHLAKSTSKSQPPAALDDADHEIDISEYLYIDGVIMSRQQAVGLGLTRREDVRGWGGRGVG